MPMINAVVDLSVHASVSIIRVNAPPVNALSASVRSGLITAFEDAAADKSTEAILLLCAGKTFFAGADIKEFGRPMASPTLQDVQRKIEASSKPVVAAIHGAALGGGLEIALVASHRIALSSAKLGLPEVKLGLIPGAGGTQLLPRLVPVDIALEMIVLGEPVTAGQALGLGLIDELVEENLFEHALAFASRVASRSESRLQTRDRPPTPGRSPYPSIFQNFRTANAKRLRNSDAADAAIKAVQIAIDLPFEQGLAEERRLFEGLMVGSQSAALRHVFFAERTASKLPDEPKGGDVKSVETVGVIGAGTMGAGIAMTFLNAGFPVSLVEQSRENLERGVATIHKQYQTSVKKGRLAVRDADSRLALLIPSISMQDLDQCDLVIEAAFERMDVKKDIFRALDLIAKEDAILATNTSYLDLDEIAAETKRPEQVIGLHFFSPAHVMKLLEIVQGAKTSPAVVRSAMGVSRKIGKLGVVVGVCFGFVGNRMLAQRQREAQKLILEGASPWDIDRVLYDFGLPMGPFAMSDLAGLDLGWDPATSSSSTVREILCEKDRRGQKTGAGFYDYDEKRRPSPSQITERIILEFSERQGIPRRKIDDREILDRCLLSMVNEGAKILEEGKASRASDIDVIWINGYGWPAYRGGPMYWADQRGLEQILASLEAFQKEWGEDFRPAPLLRKLVAERETFGSWDNRASRP